MLASQINFDPAIAIGLLEDGSDLYAVDEDGLDALSYAIIYRNDAVSEVLLDWGVDINSARSGGYTPLLYLLEYAYSPDELTFALDHGADVQARTHDGFTSLMLAATNRLSREMFALLVEEGANLKTRDIYGKTALMHALENNSEYEVIEYLIEVGSSLTAQDEIGRIPLHFAAIYAEKPEMIDLLLDAGSEGWTSDYDGLTAFEHAKDNPNIAYTQQYWRLNDDRFTDWDW